MKKLAYVLVVMFIAALGTSTYASTNLVINDETTVVVEFNHDKKPCPADCKKECCTAKATDSKEAKADCDKTAKAAGCDKVEKKSCCPGAKSAEKPAEKAEEKPASTDKK